jgi:hypothetical protein
VHTLKFKLCVLIILFPTVLAVKPIQTTYWVDGIVDPTDPATNDIGIWCNSSVHIYKTNALWDTNYPVAANGVNVRIRVIINLSDGSFVMRNVAHTNFGYGICVVSEIFIYLEYSF